MSPSHAAACCPTPSGPPAARPALRGHQPPAVGRDSWGAQEPARHFIIRELYIYIGVMFHAAVRTLYPSLLRGASWACHRCPNPKHQNELCFSEHWQKLRHGDTKQRGAEQLPGTRREAAFASLPPKPSQGQRQRRQWRRLGAAFTHPRWHRAAVGGSAGSTGDAGAAAHLCVINPGRYRLPEQGPAAPAGGAVPGEGSAVFGGRFKLFRASCLYVQGGDDDDDNDDSGALCGMGWYCCSMLRINSKR